MVTTAQPRLSSSRQTVQNQQDPAWGIPPEQQENIAEFLESLAASIDGPPSEESIDQWQATVQAALADEMVTREEWQAIAQATLSVFDSMGLTNAEVRSLAYDLQDIAEAPRLPREDDRLVGSEAHDLLWGKTGTDTLIGTPTDGSGEIDVLIGGGGTDTFVLGNDITAFYDDGLASTVGLYDYALIVDFNREYDYIQLHGTAADYRLGALPAGSPVAGTGIYLTVGNRTPELIGVVMGVDVTDFSQGFTFVG